MASADFRGALEVLEGLYKETTAGSGRLALVTGGLGVGKTRLLHAFSRQAADSGALVLMSIGARAERHLQGGVSYQLFHSADLPADIRSRVAPLIAPRSGSSDGADQDIGVVMPGELRSAQLLCDALLELARHQPVVVCVDDIQFADRFSLRFLLHLQRRLATSRVLMVLTYWEWPQLTLPLFHAEMTRLPHHRIGLRPLSVPDVTELVADALGEPAAERYGAVFHRASGGNPLLAGALIEDHRSGPRLEDVNGEPRPAAGQAYRQAILTCLHRWDPLLPQVAQGLAVLGGHAAPGDIADLLALAAGPADHALRVLENAGLLEDGCFRDPAGREAVLSGLPPQELVRLHLRAAELRHQRGAVATEVADHLVAAGEVPGPWSTAVLREAAEEALAADDPRAAVRYLQLALGSGLRECERIAVIEALACARWRINPSATPQYTPHLEAALEEGTLSRRGAALLFQHSLVQGDSAALPRTLVALNGSGNRADGRTAAEVSLACHWVFGRADRSLSEPPDDALPQRHTAADDPWARAVAALATGGAYRDHDALVLGAERILQNCRLSDITLAAIATALGALVEAQELEKAAHWCDALIAEATRRQAPAWRAVLESLRAYVALNSGALAASAAHAERALSLISASAWGVLIGGPLSTLVLANVAMERLDAAAEALRRRVPAAMSDTMFGLHYLRARGRYHLATNSVLAAVSDFQNCRRLMNSWGQGHTTLMRLLGTDLAEADLLLGRTAAARELVTEHLRAVPQVDTRVRAISLRLLARCSEPAQRPGTLKQAVRCAQASGDRWELARALDELGRAYQESGDGERAREAIRRAVQETRACLATTVPAEPGVRAPAVGSADGRAKVPSPPVLSDAEHRVAVLAARGHTNRAIGRRLYITVSTVEQHLTRVYKKLGVNGRVDLAAGLALHGVTEAGPEEETRGTA
jgi:DNA-binding CsgD family transcriptional regulator